MSKVPKPKVLSSWDALQGEYVANKDNWDGWLFRGQSYRKENNSQPSLKTSLERAMDRFGVPPKKAAKLEYQIFRDFKRRCHLATPYTPADDNVMEWLALLRHYGGPARLQDWTYSFWNAVYFALDRARNDKDTCEVWALNARWWQKLAESKYKGLKKVLNDYGSNSVQESKAVLKST